MALTSRGGATAKRLAEGLGGRLHLPARLSGAFPEAEPFDVPVAELIGKLWENAEAFCLAMAAGIAVRSVAPLLASKYSDPAVVVFDPEGRYAVPILSGHLGGANELATKAACLLGGQAVLTTATDAARAPAIEVWAARAGLAIENPAMVARINRALAEGEGIALSLEEGVGDISSLADLAGYDSPDGPKVAITDRLPAPADALVLRPGTLALGVGSRRGADPEGMKAGVAEALSRAGWSPLSVGAVATIDVKKGEPAIIALAESLGVPLLTFAAAELSAYPVKNPSERVLREVGVAGVAESAAQAALSGGRLVAEKINGGEWTLAVARLEGRWAGSKS